MLLIRLVLAVLVLCLSIVGISIAARDVDGLDSALILGLLGVLFALLCDQVSDLWGEWKKSRRVPASTDVA